LCVVIIYFCIDCYNHNVAKMLVYRMIYENSYKPQLFVI